MRAAIAVAAFAAVAQAAARPDGTGQNPGSLPSLPGTPGSTAPNLTPGPQGPPSGSCKSNADCKDPQNPSCNSGTCGPASTTPPAGSCQSNADCKDPQNPSCNKGKCGPASTTTPPGSCQSNADCKDPQNPSCNNGKCGPASTTPPPSGCQSNADCKDPMNPSCNKGKCGPASTTPPPSGCQQDSDCQYNQQCKYGQCVAKTSPPPPSGGCQQDSDCQYDQTCKYGQCVAKSSGGGTSYPPPPTGGNTYTYPTTGESSGYSSSYKPQGYGTGYQYGAGYSAGQYTSPAPSYSYTPTYSSSYGGQSAVYPPSCAWSKPHPPPAPANCDYGSHNEQYPYPIVYPAVGDYGQPHNNGNDYCPKGWTRPTGPWGFECPAHGESVPCGKPYTIKHYGLTCKTFAIDVVYGQGDDDCNHYTRVTDSCDNTGSYTWTPDHYIPPCGGLYGYGLKFTCHETNDVYYTPQFNFENPTFYETCKHPACPTAAPAPVTYSQCSCVPPPPPAACNTTTPAAPAASAPAAAPAAAGNSTVTPYTSVASGFKSSFSFVAGLAAAVAFVL